MEKKKTKITCIDQGPWDVYIDRDNHILIISDDFTHNVTIDIRGNFDGYDTKRRYAQFICEALNEKAEKIGLTLESLTCYENS